MSSSSFKYIKCFKNNKYGDVYLATNSSKKDVVVKRINIDLVNPEFIAAELSACTLSHPNIVRVFSYFHENNYYYMEMEHLKGLDLYDFIANRGFVPLCETEVK